MIYSKSLGVHAATFTVMTYMWLAGRPSANLKIPLFFQSHCPQKFPTFVITSSILLFVFTFTHTLTRTHAHTLYGWYIYSFIQARRRFYQRPEGGGRQPTTR